MRRRSMTLRLEPVPDFVCSGEKILSGEGVSTRRAFEARNFESPSVGVTAFNREDDTFESPDSVAVAVVETPLASS